jgi:hypothetical protein
MAETRKNIKVFLGSPGDLSEERKVAKAVAEECNGLLADRLGYQIELVGWEDTVSVYGRPQATINRELARCELFIGLMWKHWGSPPDASSTYTSGFEEEFRESLARRENEGRPEISMFFKAIDGDLLRDPGASLSRVIAFKKELVDGKKILFEEFSDNTQLAYKLRRCLTNYVFNLHDSNVDPSPDESQAVDTAKTPRVTAPDVDHSIFQKEGIDFLKSFLVNNATSYEASIKPTDVARLRLIASVTRTSENDADPLGVHDLNLLYAEKDIHQFSRNEISGLLSDGLEHYTHENAPLWHWYSKSDFYLDNALVIFTLFGSVARRVGAIRAITFLGLRRLDFKQIDRNAILNSWFADDTSWSVRFQGLKYLGAWGDLVDIDLISKEIEKKDSNTLSAAIEAMIRVNFRIGREQALVVINAQQPATLPIDLVEAIFMNGGSLTTPTLVEAISNQNSTVRRLAAGELERRKEISIEMVPKLIGDSLPEVRLSGVHAAILHGQKFTNTQVQSILMPPTKSAGGLGSILDLRGQIVFDEFRDKQFGRAPIAELESLSISNTIYDQESYFALASRTFSKRGNALRKSVRDQFKSEFDQEIKRVKNLYPNDNEFIKQTEGLSDFVRAKLTRKAMNIIVRKMKPEDISLVRNALSSGFIEWNEHDFAYFEKLGEWTDVELLINSTYNWRHDISMFYSSYQNDNTKMHYLIAVALYAIGKERLVELLSIKMNTRVIKHLIWISNDKIFRSIPTEIIDALLNNEEEIIRKSTALKCAKSLSKSKNKSLLERQMDKNRQRY